MNIITKQAIRKPAFTVCMIILLALAMALTGIGCLAFMGVKAQKEDVSNAYTTIAIPNKDYSDISVYDISFAMQKSMRAFWAAEEAPLVDMIDRRCLLSAHVIGQKSLSSSRVDPSEYNRVLDEECYSLSVFAVKCEELEMLSFDDPFEQDGVAFDGRMEYWAKFSIEDAVSLSDAYDCFPAPETLFLDSIYFNPDGSCQFEKGRTYLIFGGYYRETGEITHRFEAYPSYLIARYDPEKILDGEKDKMLYKYPAEDVLPWVAEYNGSWQDFVNSEAGTVWREKIIPISQMNQNSAQVILTDKVTSMYSLNVGQTTLLSGRFFTQTEYDKGEAVCMISASYAEINGLELGDTLTLDMYNSRHKECTNGASVKSGATYIDPGPFVQRQLFTEEDSIDVCKDYTIVGIYTGPRFSFGYYHFNADTILIPKASVPDAEQYEAPASPLLNTFILENGTADEFEAYMAGLGYEGEYLYFDQEYTEAEDSLNAMLANALRLFLIGIAAYLLVGALFFVLSLRRIAPVARGARLLGRSAKLVGQDIAVALCMQILCAVITGALLAAVLFGSVTEKLLSAALEIDPVSLIVVFAVQLVIMAAIGVFLAISTANHNLMKAKE